MGIQFLIDSASDVLPREAKSLGVTHLPLTVSFGEETYQDAVDISHEEFYEKLANCKTLPTTSQISPVLFEEQFQKLTEAGDSVVAITISSKLSGTYQSAMIAAGEYPGKVFVVDSLTAAVGERILLQRGLELEKQGLSAEKIANALDEEKKRLHLVAIINTLEYLKKGGRISSAVAIAGGLLGIKPAIEVKDGGVVMAGTARGAGKCHSLMKDLIQKNGGIDFEKPFGAVYSGKDDTLLREFLNDSTELWQGHTPPVCSLGSAIGTHIGPGAYGVAFFER